MKRVPIPSPHQGVDCSRSPWDVQDRTWGDLMSEPIMRGKTTCRERTTFPWQGRLVKDVPDSPTCKAGTLVAVTGKTGKNFSVQVGRVRDKPAGPVLTVGQEYVDEAVGAVIEQVPLL